MLKHISKPCQSLQAFKGAGEERQQQSRTISHYYVTYREIWVPLFCILWIICSNDHSPHHTASYTATCHPNSVGYMLARNRANLLRLLAKNFLCSCQKGKFSFSCSLSRELGTQSHLSVVQFASPM